MHVFQFVRGKWREKLIDIDRAQIVRNEEEAAHTEATTAPQRESNGVKLTPQKKKHASMPVTNTPLKFVLAPGATMASRAFLDKKSKIIFYIARLLIFFSN